MIAARPSHETRTSLCLKLAAATQGMAAAAARVDHADLVAKEVDLRAIVQLLMRSDADETSDDSVRSSVRAAAALITIAQHALEAARAKLGEDVRRESRLRSAYKTP